MATSPQPPRPPAPPQPPRRSSPVILIVLLVLAMIVVAAGLAVWAGLHVIAHAVHVQVEQSGNGQKEVSIKTPLGSLEVHPDVNAASLDLPIYPGAHRMKDHNSATVDISVADEAKMSVLAAKFETTDSYEKVRIFYHDRLGDQMTKYQEKDEQGKTVFELKNDDEHRVVVLKSAGDKTEIELVRVFEGHNEGN
jgi:hypothetical protein